MLSTESGSSCFINSQSIPSINRTTSLLAETGYVNPDFFTRRRLKYYDISISKIMDVKALRAKGNGVMDNSVASFGHNGRTAHVVYISYRSLLPILSLNRAKIRIQQASS
jgi:hypothetical protein